MSGPGGRICPNCGHHNAPDAAFCASCNEFLEWEESESGTGSASGGQGTTTAPRAAVAEPAVSGPAVPSPAAPGSATADASASVTSVQAAAAAGAGTGPEPATARTAALPPWPQTPAPVPAQPRTPPPGTTPEQTVPSPEVPPVPAGPAEPVRPGTSPERGVSGTVRRPGERPADPDDLPASPGTQDTPAPAPPADDLICPACAQANPRTRTLCLRCGGVLDAAVVQEERLSWWARLLRRFRRRPPRPLAAGQRPPVRAWRRPSLAIPITLVLLLGGGYLARPHLSNLIDNLRNKTAKPTPVNPKFAKASSHLKNHGPNLAFDGANNTYWAPASAGAGTGEALEAGFEQPVTLKELIIHTGVSVNKDEFLKQARPSVLDVELGEQGGKVEKKQLKLEDKPGPQTLDLEGKNVSTVRFIVRSDYGAEAKNRHTAILEIEFFGLRQ
ncbi:NADase-type glycan-binding domain-containing protein [Streptomyces sp. NPDC059378]|uniref:NADase-type glycan-binding domain-containing protein n=1 Tax=Streptomyces sp. NPDC059378 TaxID=3346815 RepID=UPI00369BBCF3